MRRLSPLLLLAILVILAGVGAVYYVQQREARRTAPATPTPLPPEISSSASNWTWSKQVNQRTVVQLSAKSFKALKSPSRLYLEDVEVRVSSPDGSTFDRFKTASAEFNNDQATLYADGEVEITTGEPVSGKPSSRLVSIRTSGLTYDSKTNTASTDRAATFRFSQGEGRSVGVRYDPASREMVMRSEAEVTWKGNGPRSQPMRVEAGEMQYKERDSVILLNQWSRLSRGDLTMNAGRSTVRIENGTARHIQSESALGVQTAPQGRRLEFGARDLAIDLGETGEVEKVVGDKEARLLSTDGSSRTAVNGDRVEMSFNASSSGSQLRQVTAKGHGRVESSSTGSGPAAQRETRIVTSDVIELEMRPGGQEINLARTLAPGVIELTSNRPGEKRRLEAERISLSYGAANRLRTLEATRVSTRTESPAPAGRAAPPPLLTWSNQLKADFDTAGSAVTQLEQWGSFRYEQGNRQGRAERATLSAKPDTIVLRENARFWDPTGSLAADRILLDQASGDVTAEGNVASTREAEREQKPSAVLSTSEPIHAKAARMFSAGGNRLIRYEGGVVLWQGGNRIEADRVEINRDQQTLAAMGRVNSQFVQASRPGAKAQASIFTQVRAAEMNYSDVTRTAHYRGGVALTRAGMDVKATEIRAVFAAAESGSGLDTAYADGDVHISQPSPGRSRQGSAEHAEYYVAQSKVLLSGGAPQFVDSQRGTTRGSQLTWFADNDRLLVDGREGQPAVSRIRR